jgi:predicted site-specific integrase-resolvase
MFLCVEDMMNQISKPLKEAVNNISAISKKVKSGNLLSDRDAEVLLHLIESSRKLRDIAIRQDYQNRFTSKKLSAKYSLSKSRIYAIANMPDEDTEEKQLKLNL